MDKEDMRLIRVKLDIVRTLLQEVYQHTSSSQVGYSPGYSLGLRSEGFSVWIESALFSAGRAHELILKQLSAIPKIRRNKPKIRRSESESLTEDHSSLKILDALLSDTLLSAKPEITRNEPKNEPEIRRNESGSLTEDDSGLKTFDRLIIDLGLSTRSRRCLGSINVNTVGDLIKKTRSDLQKIKNFGKASLLEVLEKLKKCGLRLSE